MHTIEDAMKELLQRNIPADAITRAKQHRFELSARVLADKKIKVQIINNQQAPPASYNAEGDLMINEAWPYTTSEVEALIFNRAKLYHEIDHAEFTTFGQFRKKLMEQAHNQQMFLDLSNYFEDGRIEKLGKAKWQGSADYLDALLLQSVKDSTPEVIGGMVLFVRKQIWRNEAEANYWKPYEKQIIEAINAKTFKRACEIALDVTNAICKPEPAQQGQAPSPEQQQGEDKQQGQQGKGEGDGEKPSDCKGDAPSEDAGEGEGEAEGAGASAGEGASKPEDAKQGEDSAEGEREATDDSGANEGEGEDFESSQAEGAGEDSSEDESEAKGGAGSGAGKGKGNGLDACDSKTLAKLEQIVEQAVDSCEGEASEDWQAILEAAANEPEPEQAYKTAHEDALAEELAQIFASLCVEFSRIRFYGARTGAINPSALTNALTNGKCFHRREDELGAPYVALLLDASGSMSGRYAELTSAARILNGALLRAKVSTKVIVFDDACMEFRTLPVESIGKQFGGGTNTGHAMKLANDWLESEGATRALMVVVTDGAPNSMGIVLQQRQRCEAMNGHVLGVYLEDASYGNYEAQANKLPDGDFRKQNMLDHVANYRKGIAAKLEQQFNSSVILEDVKALPALLEPALAEFITGA